jgi:hypothetical protein
MSSGDIAGLPKSLTDHSVVPTYRNSSRLSSRAGSKSIETTVEPRPGPPSDQNEEVFIDFEEQAALISLKVRDTNARAAGASELIHAISQPGSERPSPELRDQPPHLGSGTEREVG